MPQLVADGSRARGGASFVVAYRLAARKVLVVGGGDVAAARVFFALEADAAVTLACAPDELQSAELRARIDRREIAWTGRAFAPDDLDGAAMVLSAAADTLLGQDIAARCRERRIPCNVADVPHLCDFWLMSQHRAGDLQIAVSTNGHGPRLANRLRLLVAAALPPRCDEAIAKIGVLRQRIRQADPDAASMGRRMKWMSEASDAPFGVLAALTEQQQGELVRLYLNGESAKTLCPVFNRPPPSLWSRLLGLLTRPLSFVAHLAALVGLGAPRRIAAAPQPAEPVLPALSVPPSQPQSSGELSPSSVSSERLVGGPGRIALVGAGPGDPELLTRRAHRLLLEADVVIADKLLPHAMLDLVRSKLHVAKKLRGRADEAQDETNDIALQALREGKFVVRLKGGDPFVFGRGGEEIVFFRKHGYEPEVVPGVSSALAAPAAALVPVTHRGAADQVLICTGHDRKGQLPNIPPYSPTRTCVFLMASDRLGDLSTILIEQGFPADCPAAVVEKATWPEQRCLRATLATLVHVVEARVTSPATVIVGASVAALDHVQL